jgi:DNA-binding CsgD family transcriptional regulator
LERSRGELGEHLARALDTYPTARDVTLSPREREIALLIARGLPNKAIGAVLGISTWTVATHLRRMFAKTGVTSRAAMVAALADAGQLTRDA